jgi:aspartate racemase
MKSVGIVGGLGPETTAEFYLEVIFECQKRNTEQRPLVAISSVPLPFEIERDLIATNTGKERYIPFLVSEAKRLEASGVDFLVMPCNSLHVFIDELRDAVSIPVLSIVEETVNYLKSNDFHTVGLISTSATIANNVYESKFTENKIGYITPNDLQRAKMDKIIQRLIMGQHLNKDRELMLEIVKELATQKVDCVALACTDLQLLIPSIDGVVIFDTMKVLAKGTVDTILS